LLLARKAICPNSSRWRCFSASCCIPASRSLGCARPLHVNTQLQNTSFPGGTHANTRKDQHGSVSSHLRLKRSGEPEETAEEFVVDRTVEAHGVLFSAASDGARLRTPRGDRVESAMHPVPGLGVVSMPRAQMAIVSLLSSSSTVERVMEAVSLTGGWFLFDNPEGRS